MFCHDDFISRKALILDRLKSPSNLSSKSYLELSISMIRIVRNHSLYHLPCGSIFSPELLLLLLHAPHCLQLVISSTYSLRIDSLMAEEFSPTVAENLVQNVNSFLHANQVTRIVVDGVLIVGAGPSGLATAACLATRNVPYTIIERSDRVGSLWRTRTYDRLHLFLPKQFCQLPLLPMPESYPFYPCRDQFVSYLDEYADRFQIKPVFNTAVITAEFVDGIGMWAVSCRRVSQEDSQQQDSMSAPAACNNHDLLADHVDVLYLAERLVIATGENAEAFMPKLPGREMYDGKIIHGSQYRNGKAYTNKKVLVVGCGNTGMEVALDLIDFNAKTSLCIRNEVPTLGLDEHALEIGDKYKGVQIRLVGQKEPSSPCGMILPKLL